MASTAGTGYITSTSEMANTLYEENRDYNNRKTWENLFSSNNASAAQSQQALTNSYTDASVSAYVSYLQNQQALKNSSIVGAGRNDIAQAYDASLANTQASYQSSLYEGQNEIETARQENENNIYSALEEQAQYSAEYTNAHYDYLQYLYDEYELGNNTLFDSANWKKYLSQTPMLDENGNEQKDEKTGEVLYDTSLKSWDQLSKTATDSNGEYSSIFDENGNLTKFGIEFFDQLENSFDIVNNGTNSSNTWSTYLKENNEDLYDWASNYNYYNYTQNGTNAGTMRTMYGMMSTDQTYSYLERMGGMTTEQIDEVFGTLNDLIDEALELAESGKKSDYKKLTKSKTYKNTTSNHTAGDYKVDKNGKIKQESIVEQTVDAIDKLCTDLNINYALQDAGITSSDLKIMMNDIINNGPNSDWGAIATGVTGGALAGSLITGASLGINGAIEAATLGVGAVAGVTLGMIAPILVGVAILGVTLFEVINSSIQNNKKARENAMNNIKDVFSQMAVNLTDFRNTNVNNGRQMQLIY